MINYILNIPYTFLGIIIALFSFPTRVKVLSKPFTFVFYVKFIWWRFGYLNKARAMALGNIIILGPEIGKFDLEHEIVHVNQYLRYPLIFPILYYIELFKKGYKNNKYEKEAFEKQTNT